MSRLMLGVVARHRFPLIVFGVFTVVASLYGIMRVNTCLIAGYDIGIFDQAVRHYAHFQAPIVPLKGDDYNIWADHFHPIIALWAPLYWVWDNIRMLCVGQALVVAATVFPLWRFVARHFTNRRWAKVFTLAVLLFWPVEALTDFDVHEIAFAVPLLAWIIDGLDRRDDRALLICSGLLLLVREDMGAVVFMVGLVRLIWARRLRVGATNRSRRGSPEDGRRQRGSDAAATNLTASTPTPASTPTSRSTSTFQRNPHWHPRDWAVSLSLMIVGLAVFYLVTSVIIPHFAVTGFQYWNYPGLGDTAKDALLTAVTQPWRVVVLLFYPWVKTATWAALLLPLALTPLRSPFALVGLPIMASRMLAGRETLWTVQFHYNAPVWIVAAMAAIDAVGRLRLDHATRLATWLSVRTQSHRAGSPGVATASKRAPRTIASRLQRLSDRIGGVTDATAPPSTREHLRQALTKLLAAILCLGLLASFTRLPPVNSMFPLHRLLTDEAWHMSRIQHDRADAAAWIPANTCVAAEDHVAGQLTSTNRVTLPGVSQHRQDFYVLDLSTASPGTTLADWTTRQALDYALDQGFHQVQQFGPIVILQAQDHTEPNIADCGPDAD